MRITRIQLKNWLNFQRIDTGDLGDRVFIIGPNAAGKSNLLDVLRFLRDVAQPALLPARRILTISEIADATMEAEARMAPATLTGSRIGLSTP